MPYDHLAGFELLPNNSFSKKNPLLQIYLDSTSLGEFKICPRRYYYSIVYGFQPRSESVHLTFGILLHEAVEKYWIFRLKHQMAHRDAQMEVVQHIMASTWSEGRPWQSDSKWKNRFTLVRTVVWYLDTYQNDPIKTIYIGSNDNVAVELPFKMETGYHALTVNEPFTLCGRLDRIGELNDVRYITDVKSTQHTLDENYYKQFNPNNQFTIYTIAAKTVYGTLVDGIIVDACQVAQSFSRFDRNIVQRTESQLNAWHHDLGYHLNNLEHCAANDDWPMNDNVCGMYGGCPFRGVCSGVSETSKRFTLRTEFKRRVWDPFFKKMDY